MEVVTTAASATAGPATRRNLDEFIDCTGSAIAEFTGSPEAKVLANISPAKPEPPFRLVMRVQAEHLDPGRVHTLTQRAARAVRAHAPGYSVGTCSVNGGVATVTAQVTSTGDWIPRHAGNLEITCAAAVAVAQALARPGPAPRQRTAPYEGTRR